MRTVGTTSRGVRCPVVRAVSYTHLNAECLLFRGKDLLAVTLELLKKDPDLFGSGAPVQPEWY